MSDKHAGGRPTKYREEFNIQAAKLCKLGAIDKDLADFFQVSEATINNWKNDYPEFLESVSMEKKYSDQKIKESLYNRALGYSHPDVHISNYKGEITVTEIEKHYPPDFNSMQLWLLNRMPEEFQNRQNINISGKLQTEALPPVSLSDLESQITEETPREED